MKKSTPKTKTSKNPAPKLAATPAKTKAPVKKSVGTPKAVTTRSSIKKAVAKKAPAKKPANKIVVSKAPVKRPPAKKAPVKKTAAKTPVKSVTKKTIVKKTVAKPVTLKKAPAKSVPASAKADLRKTMASLESRMKRADKLTRKSVKALEKAVMELDARTRKDTSTSKAALTRKVNQLSAKLTDMVAKTQEQVSSDLRTALRDPSVSNIQTALSRADQRMSAAEQAQATAISKINHHLAAMATAVDTRIEDEAKARKAAIAALQTQTENSQTALTARMETIEADTAQALSRVGDKIAELSNELTQRGTSSEISIREKVSEIALQTQAEFETYRAGLERRIEDIDKPSPSADTHHLEETIAALTSRLENLESSVAHPDAFTPNPSPAPSAPALSLVPTQAAPLPTISPQESSQTQAYDTPVTDAFSPASHIAEAGSAAAMPNPYLAANAEPAPAPVAEPVEAHHPVEFNPRNFVTATPEAPLPPPIMATEEPLRDFTQTQMAPEQATSIAPSAATVTELQPLPTGETALPYSDPAYAETDPTMAGVRIGGSNDPKFNLPKLSGRNLRVAALATGVAVVGLVAAKGLFGNKDTSTLPQQTAQQTSPAVKAEPASIGAPDTSMATIGKYEDNKAVDVAPSSPAAKTLNSAASAGDPVAQFQLGLSYLEQARTDEGVNLIRKSANQNQPAAQYRLAKLYEIGEGVSQDQDMARQLTERAATNGNRIAMHDLALYYAEGRGGVDVDLPTAAKWFEKAAERGVVDSQFNLGVLHESGQGLPKNVTDAFVWYSIAAKQGDQFAKTRVEVLKPTLEQVDLITADERVRKFSPRKIDDAANGIFRNVAWGKKSDPEAAEKVSQIKQVQTMLTELGYDVGGADGAVGPKTRTAIITFERLNSLPETGRVNSALAERLELATGA